jgi:hypothetical protein
VILPVRRLVRHGLIAIPQEFWGSDSDSRSPQR